MYSLVNQYAEEEYAKDVRKIKGKPKKKIKKISYIDKDNSSTFKTSDFNNWKRKVNKE